jgi:hypothetical protein
MSAVKLQKFLGEAPKISPELLPDTVSQYCYNAKLYSGDLIPYNGPTTLQTLDKGAGTMSIYPMDDGAGGYKWLHWLTDVDVARAPIANNTTQRIYYTGDGSPKASDYDLATTGAGTDYPYAYYNLGLPTPLAACTATAVGFSTKTTSSRARDSGNIATIVTSAAHGLNTGAFVTVTGLGGTGYNLSNVQVTVVNSTTFTYYSNGTAEATTADGAGSVNIAGTTQARTYVYTWYTAWGEESTPAPVSNTVFVKEGQQVDITGLPAAWPGSYTGTYQTTDMKVYVYRTIPSASGTLYWKVGEVDLGTTTFTDNVDFTTLTVTLATQDYDQPPDDLTGILPIHNNMLVGFFGNTVCFCEPGQPHAWPIKYRVQLDADVVAVGNYGTSIIVATTKNPWLLQGATPATMNKTKMDYVLPCVSKRSMVNMGYGVVYASEGGLAVYSAQTGGTFVTQYVHDWDTWTRGTIDPTTIIAKFYNGKYFAAHDNGSFIFQKDDQVGGYLVSSNQKYTAAFYNSTVAEFYYVFDGVLYLWDSPTEALGQLDWKSKVIVTKEYINLGAARVVADYGDDINTAVIAAENAAILAQNQAYISTLTSGGPIAGYRMNAIPIAGSLLRSVTPLQYAVTFQLYANKTLVFTTQIASSDIFRLPTGYRTDTYEVRVTGNVRIRSIHLAETPIGLRAA